MLLPPCLLGMVSHHQLLIRLGNLLAFPCWGHVSPLLPCSLYRQVTSMPQLWRWNFPAFGKGKNLQGRTLIRSGVTVQGVGASPPTPKWFQQELQPATSKEPGSGGKQEALLQLSQRGVKNFSPHTMTLTPTKPHPHC